MAAEPAKVPKYMRFVMGGSAGMAATCIVQPLDLVKTRMQMSGAGGAAKAYNNSFSALVSIIRAEGVLAVYNGLSAGLARQASYTTVRLGVFTSLMDHFKPKDGSTVPFLQKMGFAMTAGATGAFIGTPTEVALIRMTSDGIRPVAERRGYKNVFHAFYKIVSEEGVRVLWRGGVPTVVRAIFVNAAQLVTYAQAREILLGTKYYQDNIWLHFSASMISGLATTTASLPPDIAKTRMQTMKVIDGKPEYKNMVDVMVKVIRKEGIFALWKGFTPCYLRIGPHTVFTFIFLEQFQKHARSYFGVK